MRQVREDTVQHARLYGERHGNAACADAARCLPREKTPHPQTPNRDKPHCESHWRRVARRGACALQASTCSGCNAPRGERQCCDSTRCSDRPRSKRSYVGCLPRPAISAGARCVRGRCKGGPSHIPGVGLLTSSGLPGVGLLTSSGRPPQPPARLRGLPAECAVPPVAASGLQRCTTDTTHRTLDVVARPRALAMAWRARSRYRGAKTSTEALLALAPAFVARAIAVGPADCAVMEALDEARQVAASCPSPGPCPCAVRWGGPARVMRAASLVLSAATHARAEGCCNTLRAAQPDGSLAGWAADLGSNDAAMRLSGWSPAVGTLRHKRCGKAPQAPAASRQLANTTAPATRMRSMGLVVLFARVPRSKAALVADASTNQ